MPELVVQVSAYYPPHEGGVEVVAEKTSRQLARLKQPVRIITSNVGARFKPRHEADATHTDYEVIRLPSWDIAHTPVMRGYLKQLLKVPAGSIIHAHISQAFVPDLAYLVARRRKQAFVAHYHLDVSASGKAGFLLPWYQRNILRRTMRGSDHIVVPTKDYAAVVHELYDIPLHMISVVPNATDFTVLDKPRQAPKRGSTLKLLSVGRLAPQKNYPLLIEAMQTFKKSYPDIPFKLDIYGEGELRGEIRTLIKTRGLEADISLHRGNLPKAELEKAYEAADVFMLATTKESFGIVFAEAMTKGLPIVTTNVPGVRNVVKDGRNGLLCEQTAESIAEGLYRLAGDPLAYRAVSTHNIADAARYTWPAVAEALLLIYRNVTREAA